MHNFGSAPNRASFVNLSTDASLLNSNPSLLIFDLDGVLVDSKAIHFSTLNDALREIGLSYVITEKEHFTVYDGLSTRKKLEILNQRKGLDTKWFDQVWRRKQQLTKERISEINLDQELITIFRKLKDLGINTAVASNSVKDTVVQTLKSLGIISFVDIVVSNEDVSHPKPHPEMYWKCMTHFGLFPRQVSIFEDSAIGQKAAISSGANLINIEERSSLSWERVVDGIRLAIQGAKEMTPWQSSELNVLIPMAGAGSRFSTAGYTFPKPLIEVNGKPMIQTVVDNLNIRANYIYIVQQEHYAKYNLELLLNLITPNCSIVQVNGITEGAAATVLLAEELINNDRPLLIANSDQVVEWNSSEILYAFLTSSTSGGIVTFTATHPKWSFVKLDNDGYVSQVAEKRPISDVATVGIYFWKRGADFVKYAKQMIQRDIRTNGEFYVCPVYNEAIEDGHRFRIAHIERMWGIGTPEDLEVYLKHKIEK